MSTSPSLNGPAGLNLAPKLPRVLRVSWRVYAIVVGVLVLMLCGLYYGMKHRGETVRAASPDTKPVGPATTAGRDIARVVANVPQLPTAQQLDATAKPADPQSVVYCATDPITGAPDQFDRRTGNKCTQWYPLLQQQQPMPAAMAHRSGVRSQSVSADPSFNPAPATGPTPADREKLAMAAPTAIRASVPPSSSVQPGAMQQQLAQTALPGRAPSLEQAMREIASRAPAAAQAGPLTEKERFLAASQKHGNEDYLPSVRTAPLSPYEIRAGWGIPAVLENGINSDLPGDIKALVRSHVYDTASGMYLLIPQGSRVVGKYDSRVTYGQDRVQVVWNRIIYPDASSLDIDGMAGTDAQGQSGLRDKVDRHYKRIIGFSALTSLFAAAFEVTQRSQIGAGGYAYPTVGQTAGVAVGREVSQTGVEMTRRNLNVPPTVRIRAGERFTVRVNRDIIFDAPYRPFH